MNVEYLFLAAAAIEGGIEALKRVVLMQLVPGDQHIALRQNVAFVLSLVAGLVVAGVFQFNLFASLGSDFAAPGILITGLVIARGSNAAHRFYDFLNARTQAPMILSRTMELVEAKSLTFPEAG